VSQSLHSRRSPRRRHPLGPVLGLLALPAAACGGNETKTPEESALLSVKQEITTNLADLARASAALRAAAPAPDADGWNATSDAAAVSAMKAEWKKARIAYERVEGAIAVLFSEYDRSTDERYDGFIEEAADDNLFDGTGVTGVHAIERILWADSHPPLVVAFEAALPRYSVARFPTTQAEASAFKEGLTKKLEDDAATMRDTFMPLALDPASAFRGVIGSIAEQLEKVMLASTGEDESRYAQHTLADMRANLDGGKKTYLAFQPWLMGQTGGAAIDADIMAGFGRVETRYAALGGEALPAVPVGFNPDAPTAEQLATPYGMLFALLTTESDPDNAESLVSKMTAAADALAIPALPE
jgi:iron uptake system component EfeO